ncbi:type II toxin-antitoxin system RelE/ParE family toxin [uncultured Desulfosarcina sp.]|uniref:type II toxin-antitoxin system RelE/ParE family toxin n=1 Tax=uncultured Desulfosarcina sp. TaxID=218289 RepID=UPI0029C6E60C|nr:type II toxin-antitoxin system RelE/ParE family toxin [uncultured Desulfosarcina sp.]
MKFSFHEIAEKEFFDTVEYYEEYQAGLGLRFSEEVFAAIERICQHPYAWTGIDTQTRRCLTNKFPYGILYRIVNEHIRIMAVMHLHRKPGCWQNR